jgi:hypothetical protein
MKPGVVSECNAVGTAPCSVVPYSMSRFRRHGCEGGGAVLICGITASMSSPGCCGCAAIRLVNQPAVIAGPGSYVLGSVSDLRPRASCMGTPEPPSGSCWSAGLPARDANAECSRNMAILRSSQQTMFASMLLAPFWLNHCPSDVTQSAPCRITASCPRPWHPMLQATARKNNSTVHKAVNV